MDFRKLALVGVALTVGCGGSSFGIRGADTSASELDQLLARTPDRQPGEVLNATGKPLAIVVARSGKTTDLVAVDLGSGSELWSVPATVSSRVAIGRDFLVYADGANMVGRDINTGRELWKLLVGGELYGVATDAGGAYWVAKQKNGDSWTVTGVTGTSGSRRFRETADHRMGAPAAKDGIVYVPFLSQWIALIDARTGQSLGRVRSVDSEVSFVRSQSAGVNFGSKRGVFNVVGAAASGSKKSSAFASAVLPNELTRAHYHYDAYDPVQARYSAYDRNQKLLWRSRPGPKFTYQHDVVAVHVFRFVFGVRPGTGGLVWAYSHPRVDLVASAHLGSALAFASQRGELFTLNPTTGAPTSFVKLDRMITGATFDADGFSPASKVSELPAGRVSEVLGEIVNDRDRRFVSIKEYAVGELSRQGSRNIVDLLAVLGNPDTALSVYNRTAQAIVGTVGPGDIGALIAALSVKTSFVGGTRAQAVGVIARALAAASLRKSGTGEPALPPKARAAAVDALVERLWDPATVLADLDDVITVLASLGSASDLSNIRNFILLHRGHRLSHGDIGKASVDALLAHGQAHDRELVRFISEDSQTGIALAAYAREQVAKHAPNP